MTSWTRVAKITRTKGSKGSVVCVAVDGLPFLLSEGLHVYFVPPAMRGVRQASVTGVSPMPRGQFDVAFDKVGSLAQAKALVGSFCLAARADVEAPEPSGPESWAGFSVSDERFGDLGTVVEAQASSMQDRVVVRGRFGDVVVPVVDEFVRDVDEEGRRLTTSVPKGLVELAQQESPNPDASLPSVVASGLVASDGRTADEGPGPTASDGRKPGAGSDPAASDVSAPDEATDGGASDRRRGERR